MIILKFNEGKSFDLGKEVLDNISDICLSLKDEFIEYQIFPDPSNDIHIMVLGIYLNGGQKRTKFELNIKVKKLNEEQTKGLFLTIQQLENYLHSEGITCSYELHYEKIFPKGWGRVGESTNIVKSETFDQSMMNKPNYRNEDNLCRRIIIKFERENNI